MTVSLVLCGETHCEAKSPEALVYNLEVLTIDRHLQNIERCQSERPAGGRAIVCQF